MCRPLFVSWAVLVLCSASSFAQVNHNPSFVPGNDITVVMNSGAVVTPWATNISDNDGGGQLLTFTATPSNAQLFDGAVLLSNAGTLSFTPATDTVGSSLVSVTLNDDGSSSCASCVPACSPADCRLSTTHQLTVTVTPVNQCPSWNIAQTTFTLNENSAALTRTNFATAVSPGSPNHESTQTLTWDVVVSETTLFSVLPTIDYTAGSSTGNLRFQPAPNQHGQSTVWVTLLDNGGASNGGCDRAATKSFSITVDPVNSNPSFVAGPNPVTVEENSGPYRRGGWATQITAGANEEEQTTSFTVVLVDSSHAALFKTLPAIDSSGQLTFEPEQNKNTINKVVEVRVQLTDNLGGESCSLSSCGRLRIVISPVNQKPSFTAGGDITVWEDRKDLSSGQSATFNWATDITPGNSDEITEGQTVRFVVTSTNSNLFSTPPAVSPTGVLSFSLNQYQNGASQVSVTIWDSENQNQIGNTAEFALNVLPSNNAPIFSFVPSQPYTVLQNSRTTSIGTFITGLAPGPEAADDEDRQQVWLTVSGTPVEFFAQQPVLTSTSSTTSKLDFTIADNKYGTATIHVTAHGDGGTVRRGVNQRTQTFTVNVQQVNAAPTFELSQTTITENENQFPVGRTVSTLVRSITSGPYEAATGPTAQTVSLTVASTNSDLFSTAPSVNAQGDLSYTVKADAFGSATLTITATDNGSPPLSTSKALQLVVAPVNHAPSFNVGTELSNATLSECRSHPSCAYSFSGWASSMTVGPANEASQTHHFTVDTGSAADLFGVPPAIDPSSGTLTFTLVPFANTVASGPRSMVISMVDTGGSERGGTDRVQRTVSISVAPYAGQPVAALGNSLRLRRNGPSVTVAQFLTQIDPGNTGSDALGLNYTVVPSNPGDFAETPRVFATTTTTASIEARPASHVFGTKSAVVRIENPITGLSTQIEFAVVIIFVNEAPSFNVTGEVTVYQGDTAFTSVVVTNISVGRNEEALQQHSFSITCTTTDGSNLFVSQPMIDTNGLLRCGVAKYATGDASCAVLMRDTGGTADGGVDVAGPKRFTLRVLRVNHAPTFAAQVTRISVLQNSGRFASFGWASRLSSGEGDEGLNQALSFVVKCCTSAAELFEQSVSVDTATGTLSFTPHPNRVGQCACRVYLVDDGPGDSPNVNQSTAVEIDITVVAVNQPPTLSVPNRSVTVVARAAPFAFADFVTSVSPGPASEASQTVRTTAIVSSGSSIFTVAPQVVNGTLTFTTAVTASGVSSVSLCAVDDGGTLNGGIDRTCVIVGISVVMGQQAPDFGIANLTVFQLQRAGTVVIRGFLTDLATQSGTANTVVDIALHGSSAETCSSSFTMLPVIAVATGDLQFAASDDFFGTCHTVVSVRDSLSGRETSRQMSIVVLEVNLPPTFTDGPVSVSVPYSSSEIRISWATAISAGSGAESSRQSVRGIATVRSPGVFVGDFVTLDHDGTIRFNISRNGPATADVDVRFVDDGGTANGGSDSSRQSSVRIVVFGVNTAPSFVSPAQLRVLQGAGTKTVEQFATQISPGSESWEGSQSVAFHVASNVSDAFSQFPTISAAGTLTFATFATFHGVAAITIQLRDNGGVRDGGSDASLTRDVLIVVDHVNTAPSFTLARSTLYVTQGVTYFEANFVRDIGSGDANQSVTLSLEAEASFGAPISTAFAAIALAGGNLSLTPQRFFRGSVPLRVVATDSGGISNGGQNTFHSSLTVVFLQRNAAPTAEVTQAVEVVGGSSSPYRIEGFVRALSAVEQDQTVSVSVSATMPRIFTTLPSVVNGALVFGLTEINASVTSNLNVTVRDSGGTANGGVDTISFRSLLTVRAPAVAPSFTLSRTSATVSTAASARVPLIRNLAPNAVPATVAWRVSLDDPALLPFGAQIDADGTAVITTASATGPATLMIEATNAAGATSVMHTLSLMVVIPPRIRIVVDGSIDSFDRPLFRRRIAAIFGVTESQVVIVSVAPGSVVVTFYIAGLQPTMTAGAFVDRARNTNDPLHSTIRISSAAILGLNMTAPPASEVVTQPPALETAAGASDSELWLGMSSTVWLALVLCVVVIALFCCIAAVIYSRHARDGHETHPAHTSRADASTPKRKNAANSPAETYRVRVDDEEMLPQRRHRLPENKKNVREADRESANDLDAFDVEQWSDEEMEPPGDAGWYDVPATQPRAAQHADWRGTTPQDTHWFDSRTAGRPAWMSRRR